MQPAFCSHVHVTFNVVDDHDGLIDENVHFRHTALLVNALIEANKEYDLLIFPQGRHGFRQPQDRIFLEQRIRDYFIENLY